MVALRSGLLGCAEAIKEGPFEERRRHGGSELRHHGLPVGSLPVIFGPFGVV